MKRNSDTRALTARPKVRAGFEPNYAAAVDPEQSTWDRMLEEQRQRALEPSHPWFGAHYLWWAVFAVGVVFGAVLYVLLRGPG